MVQQGGALLAGVLLLLIVASWIYWLVAWFVVYGFFRTRTRSAKSFTPPVSILKPVKGVDAQAYDNFASFCQQCYPDFELLFAVADPADPVIPIIERLQREFPRVRIRLIVADAFGSNRKASLLHHLANQACHEILVASDSDMRVTPDYLRRVVAPLADEEVGLVTCPYRGEAALTFTARLEALHMGVTFLPSVLVASQLLAMRFAMGATIAIRRSDLERIGGFAAVADYLADDTQLALRISKLGREVRVSEYTVASILGATSFLEQWNREVRWMRTNRICRPREYPVLLVTFSTPLAVALLLASGYAPLGWRALITSILLRWLVGWAVTGYTGDEEARRWLIWLPIRDMLSALVWCVGGLGKRIVWRGEEFRVARGGRLEPVPLARPQPVDPGGRAVRF